MPSSLAPRVHLAHGCSATTRARTTLAAMTATRHPVRFLVGFGVLYVVLAGLAELGASGWHGVVILAAVLVVVLVVDRVLGGPALASVLGRPSVGTVMVAVVVAALVQGVYPLAAALSGASFRLRPGWPVLLVGVLAFHGVAEELVWRGYAFRRLREGHSFGKAVLLTMPLLAATHVPVILSAGLTVGLAAMLVAAVTSLPLAYLFELGGGTLWAPALLHAGIDTFKIVDVPDSARLTFSLTLAAVSLTVPLLALVHHHPKEKQ
jgi:membrane protease YdiL (CAAX protease family)